MSLHYWHEFAELTWTCAELTRIFAWICWIYITFCRIYVNLHKFLLNLLEFAHIVRRRPSSTWERRRTPWTRATWPRSTTAGQWAHMPSAHRFCFKTGRDWPASTRKGGLCCTRCVTALVPHFLLFFSFFHRFAFFFWWFITDRRFHVSKCEFYIFFAVSASITLFQHTPSLN